MKPKRYAIVEVPEGYSDYLPIQACGGLWNILTGPVELMQAACKEAGVKYTTPQKGDWFMYCDMTWHTSAIKSGGIGSGIM